MAARKTTGKDKGKSGDEGGGLPPDGIPQPIDRDGRISVLVEMRYMPGGSGAMAIGTAEGMSGDGFAVDHEFEPVSMGGGAGFGAAGGAPDETFILRGTVSGEEEMSALRARPEIAGVWRDTPIAPFPGKNPTEPSLGGEGMAACPIPPCDCDPATPKGTIADVATYLGVDQIWAAGYRGTGIVVGVLDSGITAQGRPVKPGETARRIPRVIGGWPLDDWGTETGKWSGHGNMCATDVLGMAPDAQLYDLRIAGSGGSPGTISRALQAFNWAINQYRTNGTPQILTNSWGIFQETWDTSYARNPNHPFTRKVVEAINEGIIVLFAAGNCGDTCPDGRCGADNGPGRSIWGANGHPLVMTVGAVNKNEQFIGYSSRGPAALDPNKPDFCSISHFTGYFNSDSGTSAATPILAGAVALLKQSKPSATQAQLKSLLRATAKDIGPAGFDQHSGAGIVQIKAAFDRLHLTIRPTLVGPTCPRRTIAGPTCPRPTLSGPRCPRPTLIDCPRPTLSGPTCPRPTLVGPSCPRLTTTGCPRPTTVGPYCPRLTVANCPRPTVIDCPRLTVANCPRPTVVNCPRLTVANCPRPTIAGCPRPTLGCFGASGEYYDPYGNAGWSGYEEWDEAAYQDYAAAAAYGQGWEEGYDPQADSGYWEEDYWYDEDY